MPGNRENRRTTYTYDDVGQETSRQYQDNTRVTQTYDAAGQRTVLWDATGRTTTTGVKALPFAML